METRPGTSAAIVPRGARRALVLVSVLLLVLHGLLAGPALAQTTEPPEAEVSSAGATDGAVAGQAVAETGEDAATADDDEDDEAEDKVRLIVWLLVGTSALAVVLTGLFWYHTIPSRRVIAARRRRARAARTRGPRRSRAEGPDDLRVS